MNYYNLKDIPINKEVFDENKKFLEGKDLHNPDMINNPDHYKAKTLEAIQVIDEFTADMVGMDAVCTATILKYILRWNKKNGIEDLKKAQWYLNYLIYSKEGE